MEIASLRKLYKKIHGTCLDGGFHKWGIPQMDGFWGKISWKWMITRGTNISGNPHIKTQDWEIKQVHSVWEEYEWTWICGWEVGMLDEYLVGLSSGEFHSHITSSLGGFSHTPRGSSTMFSCFSCLVLFYQPQKRLRTVEPHYMFLPADDVLFEVCISSGWLTFVEKLGYLGMIPEVMLCIVMHCLTISNHCN